MRERGVRGRDRKVKKVERSQQTKEGLEERGH
jgi:hypothetical protein